MTEIRLMKPAEWPQLRRFTLEAVFVPDGAENPDPAVVDDPALRVYYEGFGRPGDIALVAQEEDGLLSAAAWSRLFPAGEAGFGTLDERTPECSVAVLPSFRGRGLGTALMKALLDELKAGGYERVSLSVQRQNPAVRLYRRRGFQTVRETGSDLLMVCDLTGRSAVWDGPGSGRPGPVKPGKR